MIGRTLVLVKPDGVARGLTGEIISRFEKKGMKIIGIKMMWVDRDFSKKHYSSHIGKSFYAGLEDYIVSGPVVAMVIQGVDVVEAVRLMVGGTEPKTATPGTIRGDYAHHSYKYADSKSMSLRNIIHASGTPEEAEQEIGLWFAEKELYKFKTAYEEHTL